MFFPPGFDAGNDPLQVSDSIGIIAAASITLRRGRAKNILDVEWHGLLSTHAAKDVGGFSVGELATLVGGFHVGRSAILTRWRPPSRRGCPFNLHWRYLYRIWRSFGLQ